MTKQVKQFRYYRDGSSNNYPGTGVPGHPTYRNLISGSAFSNFVPIIQLGIQALPGTKFYLNGSNNPIIIGSTGIYELDLQGLSEINSLQFDAKSLSLIDNNANAYLIVDIIYNANKLGGGA